MEITDVRIRKVRSDGKLKATASVTFDGEFVVHDIKILDGSNGLFVAMPSRVTSSGRFIDIAHPINHNTRSKISSAVLEAYHNACESMTESI